jgi:hypothetical protein
MTHRCAHVQLKLRTKEQTTKQKTKKNEMNTNKQTKMGTITKSSKKFEHSHWLTVHRGHE